MLFRLIIGFLVSSFGLFAQETVQLYAHKMHPDEVVCNEKCMPCTPSEKDAGMIAFTKKWKIVYVPNQSYLGRAVISSRRHFGTYEEMTDEEAGEFREILNQILPALQETFKVTHFLDIIYVE